MNGTVVSGKTDRKNGKRMKVGDKIKRIRQFRGMTQAELGRKLDMGDTSQARIGQYEIGFRTPSKELLDKMAKALDVSPNALYDTTGSNTTELMEMFFWLEEENPGLMHVFQMKRIPGERVDTTEDINVYYHDNAYWPAHAPHGFWLRYGSFLDDCMTEWAFRQHELRIGLITKEEYFEWKINWPETSDDCGKRIPYKDWRKQPEEDRQQKELDTLRSLLPKRDNDLDALPNLQRLSDEQLAPLVPDLLEWLRDPQNRMARYVGDLLGERREMMIPIVEKIMAGEDEELKFGIRMELIPRMEKWVWKIRY